MAGNMTSPSIERPSKGDIQAFVDWECRFIEKDHPNAEGISLVKQCLVKRSKGVFQWLKVVAGHH